MPWSNFANQNKLTPASSEIGTSGPGPVLRSVSQADPKRHLPNNLEHNSGATEFPAEVAMFARQQATAVRSYAVGSKLWPPDWVREHINQAGTPDELLQKVIERVRQNPHEETFLEAQAILNELGRSPEGTALIRQQLSRNVIQNILKLGRGGY